MIPAIPSFYHRPETVLDVVDTVVARVLDHLGIESSAGEALDGAERRLTISVRGDRLREPWMTSSPRKITLDSIEMVRCLKVSGFR